jgi:nanoRNase/pAp phosphatase (c-di-AMP/oligoRNAs hydrolase)
MLAKNNAVIVTTGQPFTDIDALACALAYTQLLTLEGKRAECVLPGPLNKSVTDKIGGWNLKFSKTPSTQQAKYVLVDISEPEFFASFVKISNVIEVYDHRKGFENYWSDRLGRASHIELVGSCATLIWEMFVKQNQSKHISKVNANLLFTAIVSNTLNFKASVTTKRDKKAFSQLKRFIDLPKNWVETYFTDQDKEIDRDISGAIINDTKKISPIIGQLELWDSRKVIFKHLSEIENTLKAFGDSDWFLTSPSISEGINYLFTKSETVKTILKKIIDAKFDRDIGTTKKLWLRKEIFAKLKDV